MIKHAVKQHFGGLEDETLVTNYFDKLVQIPIRVPALGTQEVRAYMMMLFIENSELDAAQEARCAQRSRTSSESPGRGNESTALSSAHVESNFHLPYSHGSRQQNAWRR